MPNNTSINSPVSGKVTRNNETPGFGHVLAITDKDGIEHIFAHLNEKPNLEPYKDYVNKGDVIGNSGNSGQASNGKPYKPHLHYETRDKNKYGRGEDGWKDAVTQPKQEDLDYLDKHFIDLLGC